MLSFDASDIDARFNLSILECKLHKISNVRAFVLVLIYPYWNVNMIFGSRWVGISTSFNLSILECKCNACVDAHRCVVVLIYPYWNVN